jgi:hypothetical protein
MDKSVSFNVNIKLFKMIKKKETSKRVLIIANKVNF